MQQVLNNNNKVYCRSKERREETFRMKLKLDELLKDYEDRFQLNDTRANCTLDPKSLKLVLLQGIMEYMLENLNMFSGGYTYQLSYDDIKTMFNNHSRATRKKGGASQGLVNSFLSTTSIKNEIDNILDDFKSEMFHTFALQMDTMKIKRK